MNTVRTVAYWELHWGFKRAAYDASYDLAMLAITSA